MLEHIYPIYDPYQLCLTMDTQLHVQTAPIIFSLIF